MRGWYLQFSATFVLALAVVSCGGSGVSSTSPSSSSGSSGNATTTVTYTFTGGTPTAAAVQIGNDTFAAALLQSNKLSVSIPQGTTNYAVAFVCPPNVASGTTVTSEYIIEAATQDGTAFNWNCPMQPNTGNATGTVDVSAIPGAAYVLVRGNGSYFQLVNAPVGTFNASLPTDTTDIAFIAVDASIQPNVLAMKLLRDQKVPGPLNGGNAVVFSSGDLATNEPLFISVGSGFTTPTTASVYYYTTNGSYILLNNHSATQYPQVPAASTAGGDFYVFEANSTDTATHNSIVGVTETSTVGGVTTLPLPVPWSYSGPTPAASPTFTFNYSGFSALPAIAHQGETQWAPTPATLRMTTVTATASAQNGASTLAIPDLSSVAGFFSSPPSGTNVYWLATIYGGAARALAVNQSPPSTGSFGFVQNRGNYSQP